MIKYTEDVQNLFLSTEQMVKALIPGDGIFSGPSICITGGFIRDSLLGRLVKDIDVLVARKFESEHVTWRELGSNKSMQDNYDFGGVTALGDATLSDGRPVEFIVRNTPPDMRSTVHYHACGLSNGFFSEGELRLHESFIRDVTDQVVRFSSYSDRPYGEPVERYLKRIHVKYPDFTLEGLKEEEIHYV